MRGETYRGQIPFAPPDFIVGIPNRRPVGLDISGAKPMRLRPTIHTPCVIYVFVDGEKAGPSNLRDVWGPMARGRLASVRDTRTRIYRVCNVGSRLQNPGSIDRRAVAPVGPASHSRTKYRRRHAVIKSDGHSKPVKNIGNPCAFRHRVKIYSRCGAGRNFPSNALGVAARNYGPKQKDRRLHIG